MNRLHQFARACGLALLVAALATLQACGGGGSSSADYPGDATPPVVAPPPPAVSNTVPATGGNVTAALVNDGSVTVAVPARAASAPALSLTITPLAVDAAASGAAAQWTQFTITPGIQTVGAPLTLRVRTPAATAGQVPVLQVQTADGPVHLLTSLQTDGTLLATLKPELFAPASRNVAKPGEPNPQKDNTVRLQTAVIVPPTTISGVLLATACHLPQTFVADFDRVINDAGSAQAIRAAILALLQVRENCTAANGVPPTDVAGVSAALRGLVTSMPTVYNRSLAAWRAVDYSNFNSANYNTFIRGVRRQVALCAAIQELGSTLTCPTETDFADQYDELVQGFTDAAASREGVYGLYNDHELLLGLKNDASYLGIASAIPTLDRAISKSADRLIERAYQLCNTGELAAFVSYIAGRDPTSFTSAQVLDAAALCGTSLTIDGHSTLPGIPQNYGPHNVVPGDVHGTGRVQLQEMLVSNLASTRINIRLNGMPSRCSRVIGSPHGQEPFFMRVNDVEIGRFDLRPIGIYQELYSNETSDLLARLRREPTSTDPIVIDIYRGATQVTGCSDGSSGTYAFNLPERKIYTLRVMPDQAVDGTYVGTMTYTYRENFSNSTRSRPGQFNQQTIINVNLNTTVELSVRAVVVEGRPIAMDVLRINSVGGSATRNHNDRFPNVCDDTNRVINSATQFINPGDTVPPNLGFIRAIAERSNFTISGVLHEQGRSRGTQTVTWTQTAFFGGPGCSERGPITTVGESVNDYGQDFNLSGTGVFLGGTYMGSITGSKDLSRSLDDNIVTGTQTGNAHLSVTWELRRE